MPFQVSPGVNVSEIDLTTIVPAVSTTEGAIGGVFRWGPIGTRVLVDTEDKLVARFGKPTNHNSETFFTAANFLAYGNKLYVSRAANTTGDSAQANATLYGNSTIVLSSVANVAGITDIAGATGNTLVGFLVYGSGIPDGTTVVSQSFDVGTAGNTNLTLSKSVTLGSSSAGNVNNIIVFTDPDNVFTAVANASPFIAGNSSTIPELSSYVVKNQDHYSTKTFNTLNDVLYVAKYPGSLGNSLKISVCDSTKAFKSNVNVIANGSQVYTETGAGNTLVRPLSGNSYMSVTTGNNVIQFIINPEAGPNDTAFTSYLDAVTSQFGVGSILKVGNSTIGFQDVSITSISPSYWVSANSRIIANVTVTPAPSLFSSVNMTEVERRWEYADNFNKAPGQSDYVRKFGNTSANDELHVVVADKNGKFTGVPGTILEVFSGLSRATDAKTEDGAALYYADVINNNSNYVWFTKARSNAASNTALFVETSTNKKPLTMSFFGGSDGINENNVPLNNLFAAYDLYKSAEDVDISLLLQGKARGGTNGQQLANYLIDNIAGVRKDCVVFVSPDRADVVNNGGKTEADDIVTFRNSLSSSSYAVLDSGYKYQYDKYNDLYRYLPLNGDIAGLAVRTDNIRDPWWSPAGFNRGQIKNIIKLAYNPGKAERDILYKNDVNPVCIFPGQGTVLFGDKTLLGKPSAFDRINVRRLFIVLEKAIATAAKFTLFEFNDAFTRAQFKNLVEPFLRDVQGRRGIYDFKVVCDETNNTGEVIDRNEFVGDIYIKPARSINFIQLNFVAVRTGVEFSEVVGKF